MKLRPASIFIICMLVLFACLGIFDWLKSTIFRINHHGLVIIAKSAFLLIGGIFSMWLTMNRIAFRKFLLVYGIVWGIYLVLRVFEKISGYFSIFKGFNFSEAGANYIQYVQLLTPFPFILFWVIARVYFDERN